MRRYGFSILFVLLIVLCIGTYYIQADIRYPEFVLKKLEGDEKEATPVQLRGYLGLNPIRDTVTISSQGSEYNGERSFFEQISPYSGNEELKKLAQEHRNFMRGKWEPLSFYEDENLLVYVNVKGDSSSGELHNPRFTVSLLDKKNGLSSSYEISVPNGNLYNQISVNDVQVVGEELKVVTHNYRVGDGSSEIHLYSLGFTKEKAPVDQILLQDQKNTETNIESGFETDSLRPHRYIAFREVPFKKNPNTPGDDREETGGQLFVYQIETGQKVNIESQEFRNLVSNGPRGNDPIIRIQGDDLYLAKKTDKGLKLVQYNIPAAKKISENEIQSDFVLNATIKNGRLYFLNRKTMDEREIPTLVVADMNTGKLLYKGTVSFKETESYHNEHAELFIHDLLVN